MYIFRKVFPSNEMKKQILIRIFVATVFTAILVVTCGKEMFYKHDTIIYKDWSQCESEGYSFEDEKVISVSPDPRIVFYTSKAVERIELDITMISNVESKMNKDKDGFEYIRGELFWSDEDGGVLPEKSKVLTLVNGRNSIPINVHCGKNSLIRLDVGAGVGVEFQPISLAFHTVEEYDFIEKVKAVGLCWIFTMLVLMIHYALAKYKRNNNEKI